MYDLHWQIELLERVVPFRFLSYSQKTELLDHAELREYRAKEIILHQRDTGCDLFVIASGAVEAYDPEERRAKPGNVIIHGHYFGERSALFNEPRTYAIRAIEPTACLVIPGDYFLRLLSIAPAFAHALGDILRDRHGIFDAFERFTIKLKRSVDRGYINIDAILPLYLSLEPALHRFANDPVRIDFDALNYAVRRLPESVTTTFAFLVVDELASNAAHPDLLFDKIAVQSRRRHVWETIPGKNLVLMRPGFTDLTDFISCLCLYSIEARKFRQLLTQSNYLESIKNYLDRQDRRRDTAIKDNESDSDDIPKLPIGSEELEKLRAIWPKDYMRRLYHIACHREMFSIDIRRQRRNYNSSRTDIWTAQIAEETKRLTGRHPSALRPSTKVHIISSNVHSVINCLNPWFGNTGKRIWDWMRETHHPFIEEHWHNPHDCLYAVSNQFLRSHPEEAENIARCEKENGIVHLNETASTGIQVQLIDLKQHKQTECDPSLIAIPSDFDAILLNIDYAFGEQAEHIIRNLIMLFGNSIASINCLGKAGALIGNRGDVMYPTSFITQRTEHFCPIQEFNESSIDNLKALLPEQKIHIGPMLTVDGTLLQNPQMLNFYHHTWGCVGMEMEGSYYYYPVVEAKDLKLINDSVNARFLYYTSDLPLQHTENLSARLSATEGVPPLYAVTRHILNGIFSD